MSYQDHALYYNEAFPKRPPLAHGNGMVTGTWMIGACYKNPNPLYGAYPHGYLERVHAMFPDANNVLHAFSGGLTHKQAWYAATRWNGDPHVKIELVDVHGPEQGRYPTWQGDLLDFCFLPENDAKFDLILADPPYSKEDAAKYDVAMVNRREAIASLYNVAAPGANLVWLDQVWPQHLKREWKTWGTIGLVRSTNHRVRMVSIFEAQ
jgi:hypothetical protein